MGGLIPQNVLLVSETKIKNFTDIDGNVTSAVLLPFISVAQQTKLEYIIGGRYYRQLLEEVSNNSLTETNENFLNYFAQPLVLWAAYAECLPSIFARIKIYYKTCLSAQFDSLSYLRRADICLKQAISIQRKEVIRCLMVQLRGRGIPFGRSAADPISDAGHGMKATSGSGTSDR
jgi:hypothetical protein